MRYLLVGLLLISGAMARGGESPSVRILRVPGEGIQPQAILDDGVLHVLYYKGDRAHGDLFYVRSSDGGASFSQPLRVNSQAGSAIAAGTIRGGQIALGPKGLVHVVWNGSSTSQPRGPLNPEQEADSPYNGLPMLYSRLAADGRFSPQRNLMQRTLALDGGGSVAADEKGNVYVAWHGSSKDSAKGEGGRVVWFAKSSDDGQTFSEETPAFEESTGACGCCGMQVFADSRGRLLALYRSARETVHRDIYLLASGNRGRTFQSQRVDPWEIGACPMSSMSFSEGPAGVLAAWETAGQVFFGQVESQVAGIGGKTAAPGETGHRKHPRLAQNARGETLLVWSEVQGWGKGGELGWQLFGRDGTPLGHAGSASDLPAWSFGAPVADSDGGFLMIY